jgi:N6-L-threonylcarbamoyladenine synthase
VGLLVSGGHTILLSLSSLTKRTKLGETVDDAAGEAFDKVAKMMQLPYPGGPQIEKLAKNGNPKAIAFPRPMLASGDYEFSFSGLKTAVLYYVRDNPKYNPADAAASFQEAATDVLVKKSGAGDARGWRTFSIFMRRRCGKLVLTK